MNEADEAILEIIFRAISESNQPRMLRKRNTILSYYFLIDCANSLRILAGEGTIWFRLHTYGTVSELVLKPQAHSRLRHHHNTVWFGDSLEPSVCRAEQVHQKYWYKAFSFHCQHCPWNNLEPISLCKYWTIGEFNWKICLRKYGEGEIEKYW